ncbi:MAG TPA: right-handed parallel beta-helix repeat-containing protein, partial [bacterium]|nr:right-handed parallel beta-helix repeat-containing protein [bacterium]
MTKTRFAILLLILSVSGLLSQESVQKTPVGTVMDIFRSADRCLEKKDYEGARREYEKLAGMETVEHGRYMGLFNIAESYRLEKDYKNAHAAYRKILSDGNLNSGYRVYGLFKEAELYTETKDWRNARRVYEEVKKAGGVSPQHVFRADLLTGESYSSEGRHKEAGGIYERLLKEIDSSSYPHEGWRLDVVDRLELIDGLADGQELKSRRQLWWEKVNSPKYAVYVSLNGNDENTGTMERPFATIKKAQEEVRRIKIEKGLPGGGIAVYLRGGKYFMDESVLFGKDDSGTEDAPVVYRSYPGEEVRLIGGRQLKNFSLLKDPAVLRRLPEESRGKVWVCDLKQEGIRDYGHLSNRGMGGAPSSSMELFYNTRPMQLSRWPDEGWENVAGLATPEGDGKISGYTFQNGKFRYSGDRPERWTEEKEIWTAGYFLWQWNKVHTRVLNIDTKNKIVNLAPYIHHAKSYYAYHMPVVKDTPYYFYNILSEVSSPGEFYIDRETGSLYFYPPGKIEESEVMVSTLKAPVVKIDGGSHIALYGLTVECGWSSGIQVEEGSTNLIAGCVVRNTGGVAVRGGWNHSVAGCDVYNTREGGIRVTGGDGLRLIHGGHHVENNHIYRTENLSHLGGTSGIGMSGSGNRISHNLIHDCTYNGMQFGGSNNVVEYNEIYDVMHEGRDGGAIYTYSAPRSLMNRGNVMRYNFIHHISQHSSPLKTHQVTGLYIDGLAGGMAVLGNTFYRCTERAVFTHGPDTRIEDNMFVDCEVGITQSNRTYLLREERSVRNWEKLTLNLLRHKLPPWSARFPQVKNIFEVTPYGEPRNI